MGKPLSWIDRDRRNGLWTAIALGWCFLGLPLALLVSRFDKTAGLVVLGVVVAPLVVMALAATLAITLAPFFVRKPQDRLFIAPLCAIIGYALGGWLVAIGYLAAVLIVWAGVSAFGAIRNSGSTVRLPS
ncbi:hypothetical protein [Sphingopyxis lindanitolerans]|nr:hypothetical protein [Sphingopyxis lindanitolerans]